MLCANQDFWSDFRTPGKCQREHGILRRVLGKGGADRGATVRRHHPRGAGRAGVQNPAARFQVRGAPALVVLGLHAVPRCRRRRQRQPPLEGAPAAAGGRLANLREASQEQHLQGPAGPQGHHLGDRLPGREAEPCLEKTSLLARTRRGEDQSVFLLLIYEHFGAYCDK